jgi:hypothetical protein
MSAEPVVGDLALKILGPYKLEYVGSQSAMRDVVCGAVGILDASSHRSAFHCAGYFAPQASGTEKSFSPKLETTLSFNS